MNEIYAQMFVQYATAALQGNLASLGPRGVLSLNREEMKQIVPLVTRFSLSIAKVMAQMTVNELQKGGSFPPAAIVRARADEQVFTDALNQAKAEAVGGNTTTAKVDPVHPFPTVTPAGPGAPHPPAQSAIPDWARGKTPEELQEAFDAMTGGITGNGSPPSYQQG